MKISVDKNSLIKSLQVINSLIKSGVSLPILSNGLLEVSEDKILVKATDLNSGVVFSLDGEIEVEGKICFSVNSLLEYLQTLDSGKIKLEVKESKLIIIQNKSKAQIPLVDFSEYPDFSPGKVEKLVEVDFEEFSKNLKNVMISIASNEGRAVLEGILIKQGKKNLQMVGTDGYRLSVCNLSFEGEWLRDVLVPAKTLGFLLKNINDSKIKIGIDDKNSQLYIETEDRVVVIRLIAEEFPNFSKIIPNGEETLIRISKEDFALAVGQMAVFARQNANIIKFEAEKEIKLSTQSGYVGSGEVELEAKITGEKILTAFNYRYLKEYLNVISGEEIKVTLNGALSPVKFESDSKESFLHIIMPVKL